MSLTESLRILITANGAQAEREFAKTGAAAKRGMGQAETAAQQMGRSLTSAGVAMATFGGVALFGLYKAAQAADAENRAILQLNNSIENSPALVGASTDAFLEQAAALQDSTTYADDMVISAQAMLATFRLTESQITQLTPLVADLSSKFGVDLNTAAIAVGKAMQGNTTTLRRWGVFIEDGANSTEDFNNLLEGLRENAGGFAAAEGQTFSGQLTILKNNLGDVAEGIGQGVIPAFNAMLGPVESAADSFTSMNPAVQGTVGSILAFGSAGLVFAGGASFVAGQALTMIDRMEKLRKTAVGARLATVGVGGAMAYGGLALAGLAAVTTAFIGKQQAAEQRTLAFADALEQQADGAERAVEEMVANIVSTQEEFTAGWEGMGASIGDISQAIMGNEAAFDRVAAAAEEYQNAIDPRADASEFNERRFEAGRLVTAIEQQRDALRSAQGQAQAADRALDGMGGSAEDAAESVDALNEAWSGLDNSLSQFDAVTNARQALMDLQTGFQEAAADGVIAADEMLNLRGTVSGLVNAYQEVARAQNTNADGTVDTAAANAQLLSMLQSVRAFIPAQLLPQFDAATRGLRGIRNAAGTIPRDIEILIRMIGADGVLDDLQAIYRAAVDAANAVGQTGGSLAGGGSYRPPAQPRTAPSGGGGRSAAESAPRSASPAELARELARTPLLVKVVD